ncbi:methyl-accepting chemotaxis protein [Cedecea colo]|uniref:HAMP domain-containing protein n=1 Tax=Cedecea colo TaxID=2552946 RepID=A0ABX0VR06_9ENTR|nr:methyl-accepting chemotaxis protein [Cedecea colo]NIY48700.1 HAMP domain-containing protein [Cedecea colo]
MLKSIKIVTSLTIFLMLLGVLQFASSGASLYSLKEDKENFEVLDALNQRRAAVNEAWIALLQARNDISFAIIYLGEKDIRDAASLQKEAAVFIQNASASLEVAAQRWSDYESLPQQLNDFTADELKRSYFILYNAQLDLIKLLKAGDIQSARNQPTQNYIDKFEEQYEIYRKNVTQHYTLTINDTNRNFDIFLITIAVVLTLMLLVNVFIWRGMKAALLTPLNKIIDGIRRIANGDLSHKIDIQSANEMGQLADTLSHMQKELSGTVGHVRAGAEAIFTGASEISTGNNDLSSRTEQQAASLEETAASMEQLTATVKQNADNASQASQLALNASETARRGGRVVDNVVHTMSDIATSSQKIADITSVIDGIAFQTNILALNAAVEAARAGEQGRGFAVVASEVRSLAQRSAQAAREIKTLIDDSVSKVEVGSAQVKSAGETMGEIVSAITSVTDIMSEIASASDEQSRGIDQVGQAVSEMDRVTQQNASLVEESAAAAAALEEQASLLTQAVSVFRLNQDSLVETRKKTARPAVIPAVVRQPVKADTSENWETF